MKNALKRALAAMLMLAVVFGLFTLTTASAAQLSDLHPLSQEQLQDFAEQMEAEANRLETRKISLTEQARQMALSDFEYLVSTILRAAPTQNMIYERTGMAAEVFFASFHQKIYNNIPLVSYIAFDKPERWAQPRNDARYIAADYLFSLLDIMGGRLDGLGHMFTKWPSYVERRFFALAALHAGDNLDSHGERHFEIFNTPSVLWFYDIDPDDYDDDRVVWDMDPGNVTTRIIAPGSIAYISIASFSNDMDFDAEILFPFYEQIQNFEHLIIDIRGNSGGSPSYFDFNVVQKLIDWRISFSYVVFYMDTEITAPFINEPRSSFVGLQHTKAPAGAFVRENDLPYFNLEDLELLDYAVTWTVNFWWADDNIPFGGKVWLLVDGDSASASEMAAIISMGTGFATVVGENTAGITGVNNTYAALPNTGILFRIDIGYSVDQFGRSFERYGVTPQIRNFEGMDALETVLHLIEIGDFIMPERVFRPRGFDWEIFLIFVVFFVIVGGLIGLIVYKIKKRRKTATASPAVGYASAAPPYGTKPGGVPPYVAKPGGVPPYGAKPTTAPNSTYSTSGQRPSKPPAAGNICRKCGTSQPTGALFCGNCKNMMK